MAIVFREERVGFEKKEIKKRTRELKEAVFVLFRERGGKPKGRRLVLFFFSF